MERHQNYTREVAQDKEEALSKIVLKVPQESVVLDVGCGSGMLGNFLVDNRRCVVDGADMDQAALRLASAKYRNVAVVNLERDSLLSKFQVNTYDCIVVADVIEHLVSPDYLLREIRELLKPNGLVLFSVPNITHIAAGLELVSGQFNYRNNGLLDSTHLRFYTRESLVARLAESLLYTWEIDTVQKNFDATEFPKTGLFPQRWIEDIISSRGDALTYQWIVTARLSKPEVMIEVDPIHPSSLTTSLASRLYWKQNQSDDFQEDNSIYSRGRFGSDGHHVLSFEFTRESCTHPLVSIRLDPVDSGMPFICCGARLFTKNKEVIWSTKMLRPEEWPNAKITELADEGGFLVLPTNGNPHWFIQLNNDVLRKLGPGCALELNLIDNTVMVSKAISSLINIDTSRVKELELRTEAQESELHTLRRLLNESDVEFAKMRSSRSWRVTKPLRNISTSLSPVLKILAGMRNATLATRQTMGRCMGVGELEDGGIKRSANQGATLARSPQQFSSPGYAPKIENASAPISALIRRVQNEPHGRPIILFDHNGGGGSNAYSSKLVKTANSAGTAVIRVYCFNARWFVEWKEVQKDELYQTQSISELFEVLAMVPSEEIIVNSVYGYPDVPAALSKIEALAKLHGAGLEFKVHDFYALCSSPHLSDSSGKYCGVPSDQKVCRGCLAKNLSWYHEWFPKENRPTDIAEWRRPFTSFFNTADKITFFDESSVSIAQKAFVINTEKIRVVPHSEDKFDFSEPIYLGGGLHIGLIGTLSSIKGGSVVAELAEYIHKFGLNIPISVIGQSYTPNLVDVDIYGKYDVKDLPKIVSSKAVNVVLIPSIVPETFSYTISEAIQMGLPIVAFDIGAQGARVSKYEWGKTVPLGSSPEIILSAVRSVLSYAQSH